MDPAIIRCLCRIASSPKPIPFAPAPRQISGADQYWNGGNPCCSKNLWRRLHSNRPGTVFICAGNHFPSPCCLKKSSFNVKTWSMKLINKDTTPSQPRCDIKANSCIIYRSSSRFLRRNSTASVPFLPSTAPAFSSPVYFDGNKETSSSSPRSERMDCTRRDSERAVTLLSSWRYYQWQRTEACWPWPWSWGIDDWWFEAGHLVTRYSRVIYWYASMTFFDTIEIREIFLLR